MKIEHQGLGLSSINVIRPVAFVPFFHSLTDDGTSLSAFGRPITEDKKRKTFTNGEKFFFFIPHVRPWEIGFNVEE